MHPKQYMLQKTPKTFDLENIRVAAPCPVSWDSMKGDDRSRACEQCGLNVYNISGLTRDRGELI